MVFIVRTASWTCAQKKQPWGHFLAVGRSGALIQEICFFPSNCGAPSKGSLPSVLMSKVGASHLSSQPDFYASFGTFVLGTRHRPRTNTRQEALEGHFQPEVCSSIKATSLLATNRGRLVLTRKGNYEHRTFCQSIGLGFFHRVCVSPFPSRAHFPSLELPEGDLSMPSG